jgi:hypothetical protein
MAKIGTWSTTAASNNNTPPDGWPEGQAPSTVNDCAREMMAALRTALQDIQWFDHGFFPITVGGDAFTVTGDQSAFLQAGGKLKLYDGAAVIYRSIATVSASATTMVVMDAGTAVDSSLSSFAVGILSNTNGAIPNRFSTSAIEVAVLSAASATFANINIASLVATTITATDVHISRLSAASATIATLFVNVLSVSSTTHLVGTLTQGGYITVVSSGPRVELNKAGAGFMWYIDSSNKFGVSNTNGDGLTQTELAIIDTNGNFRALNNLSASGVFTTNANFGTMTAGSATINNCFIGSGVITTLTVSAVVVLGQLRGKNGTAASPSIIFDVGDLNTGFYWPGAGLISIACGGTAAVGISQYGIFMTNAGQRLQVGTGSEGTPAIFYDNTDTTTGPYWVSSGVLGWACNGVQEARLLSTGFVSQAYTVTSDAATKKDWTPLASDFVSRLADMQAGSYTKIKNDRRAIGVPAQDLQQLMPEAVLEQDGVLLANYGPAAMISAIALAKKVEELTARLEALEKK